jgi:hypothetical protein
LLTSLKTGPDQFDVDVCDFRRIHISLWWPSPNLGNLIGRFDRWQVAVHKQGFIEPPTEDPVEGFDFPPLGSLNGNLFVIGLVVQPA